MENSVRVLGWREIGSEKKNPDSSDPEPPLEENLVRISNSHRSSVVVPLSQLRPADSPRLTGLSNEHTHLLATVDNRLPPVLVHRPTMQVIDGMHRVQAAILRGESTIVAEFFDGSEDDAFLRAVQANVEHGLPLTRTDREAAIVRILGTHPHLSDRAIATIAGVSAPTVGAVRKRTTNGHHPTTRIGRDGRMRPVNSAEGRRRAGEILRDRPDASLRDVANEAGISAGTVRDVRQRMRRGEAPVPTDPAGNRRIAVPEQNCRARELTHARSEAPSYGAAVENLRKDPSLRFNKTGRSLLQWLGVHVIGPENLIEIADSVPPHCTRTVAELAWGAAETWTRLAKQLEQRADDIE